MYGYGRTLENSPENNPAAQDGAAPGGTSCLGRIFLISLFLVVAAGLTAAALASSPGGYRSTFAPGECAVSERFPEQVLQWCDMITYYAGENNLPPDLVAALIWLESDGNPRAYSHSGAVGLMQVMPRDGLASGFNCPGGPCFSDRPSSRELRDPEFNVRYGTQMLSGLLAHHSGNWREALRSYGPIDVGYSYADQVLGLYRRYKQ